MAFWRRGAIVAACLVAAVLAIVGARRWLGLGDRLTPLARVGRALVEDTPASGRKLGADVETVRSTFGDEQRAVFELLVALRGFEAGGGADWATAALFNAACAADAAVCEHLKEATEREVRARAVAPGNVMPLFSVGHPRIAGP